MFRYDFRYSIAVFWEKIYVKNNAFNHLLSNDYDNNYVHHLPMPIHLLSMFKILQLPYFLIKHAGNLLLNRNTLFKSAKSFPAYCH